METSTIKNSRNKRPNTANYQQGRKPNGQFLWQYLKWIKSHNMQKMINGKDYVNLVQLNHSWFDAIGSDIISTYKTYFLQTEFNINKLAKLAKIACKSKQMLPELKDYLEKSIPKNKVKGFYDSECHNYRYKSYNYKRDINIKDNFPYKEMSDFQNGDTSFQIGTDTAKKSLTKLYKLTVQFVKKPKLHREEVVIYEKSLDDKELECKISIPKSELQKILKKNRITSFYNEVQIRVIARSHSPVFYNQIYHNLENLLSKKKNTHNGYFYLENSQSNMENLPQQVQEMFKQQEQYIFLNNNNEEIIWDSKDQKMWIKANQVQFGNNTQRRSNNQYKRNGNYSSQRKAANRAIQFFYINKKSITKAMNKHFGQGKHQKNSSEDFGLQIQNLMPQQQRKPFQIINMNNLRRGRKK